MKVWLLMKDSPDNSFPAIYTDILGVYASEELALRKKDEQVPGEAEELYVEEWEVEQA